jgi:hypothetical protein
VHTHLTGAVEQERSEEVWALELEGDTELAEGVEALAAEQVDEQLAAHRVVALANQQLKTIEILAVERVCLCW